MGCYNSSQVTDFVRVTNKKDLVICYNMEINRLKILKDNLNLDPSINTPEGKNKLNILIKILHEDNWMILPILDNAEEQHIEKIKFLLFDYFNSADKWNLKDLEENMNKIVNYYKENKEQIKIVNKYETEIEDSYLI